MGGGPHMTLCDQSIRNLSLFNFHQEIIALNLAIVDKKSFCLFLFIIFINVYNAVMSNLIYVALCHLQLHSLSPLTSSTLFFHFFSVLFSVWFNCAKI